MLVYKAVGNTLHRLGVDTVFGLLGGGNFSVANHMVKSCGISYCGSRHEAAAVSMADGYARVSGRVGVCTVTQGPGLTNTLTALTEATKSRTSLLLVAGDTATNTLRDNQDIDQAKVAESVGVRVVQVRSADTVVDDVTRAMRTADVESLPVLLSLPVDLQGQVCEYADVSSDVETLVTACRPSSDAVSRAVDLIESSRHPVILAGRGAVRANACSQLEELGTQIGALFATSAVAKGLFSGNPYDLGIAGGFSSPLAVDLIAEADLILSFGASLNTWTTKHHKLFSPSAQVVHCDQDASAIGTIQPVTLGIVGDVAETASAVLEELVSRNVKLNGFRSDSVASSVEEFRWENEFDDEGTESSLDPRSLNIELDRVLPRERTVAIDSGHFMGFPAMHLSVPDATGFVFAQAFQSVGLGMATGMGAAVARPDRLPVVVIGDGGLMMSLGEIDAAVHYRLPVLIVVMNDAAYSAEVHHFESLGFPTDLARFNDRDFSAIATAMGAKGITVRSITDLDQLETWLASPEGPMVLDCKVNPKVRAEWLEEAFQLEPR